MRSNPIGTPKLAAGLRLHRSRHLRPPPSDAGVRGAAADGGRSGGMNSRSNQGRGSATAATGWVTKLRDVPRRSPLRTDVFLVRREIHRAAANTPEDQAQAQIEAGPRLDDHDGRSRAQPAAQESSPAASTPRAVERLRADLSERARCIAERAAAQRSGDFVPPGGLCRVCRCRPLPACLGGAAGGIVTSCSNWSNQLVGGDDPEFGRPRLADLGLAK